jgi:hypothetical protein
MGAAFSLLSVTELRPSDQVRAMAAITYEASNPLAGASRSFPPSMLECNAALMRLALVDVGIAFDCARKLSAATSASQFDEVLTRHARQHFDAVTETVAQLSTLLEKGSWEGDEKLSLTFWD